MPISVCLYLSPSLSLYLAFICISIVLHSVRATVSVLDCSLTKPVYLSVNVLSYMVVCCHVDNSYTFDPRIKRFKEEQKQKKVAEKKAKQQAAKDAAEQREKVSRISAVQDNALVVISNACHVLALILIVIVDALTGWWAEKQRTVSKRDIQTVGKTDRQATDRCINRDKQTNSPTPSFLFFRQVDNRKVTLHRNTAVVTGK